MTAQVEAPFIWSPSCPESHAEKELTKERINQLCFGFANPFGLSLIAPYTIFAHASSPQSALTVIYFVVENGPRRKGWKKGKTLLAGCYGTSGADVYFDLVSINFRKKVYHVVLVPDKDFTVFEDAKTTISSCRLYVPNIAELHPRYISEKLLLSYSRLVSSHKETVCFCYENIKVNMIYNCPVIPMIDKHVFHERSQKYGGSHSFARTRDKK